MRRIYSPVSATRRYFLYKEEEDTREGVLYQRFNIRRPVGIRGPRSVRIRMVGTGVDYANPANEGESSKPRL